MVFRALRLMCGFAGYCRIGDVPVPDLAVLEEMGGLLAHRGPDDHGVYLGEGMGMVHRRLSVIDLSRAGRQPMISDDGRVALSYNGEVYNFMDLRRVHDLDSRFRFRSRTDTEVVLRLYERIGTDVFAELNGMFALAVWDGWAQELVLARDPFGIKPLFYMVHEGIFWFASEIKALLAVPGFAPVPSREGLFLYLSFDYIPGEATAFEGIRELRPGHSMKVGRAGPAAAQRFWDFPAVEERPARPDEAIEHSMELLAAATGRQMVGDVPVGIMLSGGMDSSSLAVLAREHQPAEELHTFSLRFADPSFDESSFALEVARTARSRHHVIDVDAAAVHEVLPGYLAYIDEPYADGAAIPTFLLARRAREHVTVLLSGEGGDEVFTGYDTHLAHKVRSLYLRLPLWVRRAIAGAVELLPVSHRKLSLDWKLKRFASAAEHPPAESHFFWREVAGHQLKLKLLVDPAQYEALSSPQSLFRDVFDRFAGRDAITRLTFVDSSYHLSDDLMIKCDRMTMAWSLEARVPYTDLDLAEYLFGLPGDVKMPGSRAKHLLRTGMRGRLGRSIVARKKVGLEMPYSRWLGSEFRELAEEVFSPASVGRTGLIEPGAVSELWRDHLARRVDHGRLLWGLLNYMMWHRMYVGRPGSFRDHLSPVRPARPAPAPGPESTPEGRSPSPSRTRCSR